MMNPYIQVALGGAMGAVARHAVTRWCAALFGSAFPSGTLLVNVLGSFAIGVLAAAMLGPKGAAALAPLLVTGFLGGFTTFSAFSLDALRLVQAGQEGGAAAYVLLSILLSLTAVWAGFLLISRGYLN